VRLQNGFSATAPDRIDPPVRPCSLIAPSFPRVPAVNTFRSSIDGEDGEGIQGVLMRFDTVARRISTRLGGPIGFLIALMVGVRRVRRWRARRSLRSSM
jgi:hypothetical protein